MNNLLLGIITTLIGLCMGSFSACVGYRIPNKISIVKGRSFCPKCKKQIKWYMNIPLFSYIFLGGKCSYCNQKISKMYPIVELSGALLYFLAFEVYLNTMPIDYYSFLIAILISTTFLITIVSDFMYYYISDRVILFLIISAIVLKYTFFGFSQTLYSILSGVLLFVIMLFVKFIGDRIFKKESLGGGDIKLMGAIGCIIGIFPSLITLVLASVFGLLFSLFSKSDNKSGIIPFGPFLLLGALICFYFSFYIDYFFDFMLRI